MHGSAPRRSTLTRAIRRSSSSPRVSGRQCRRTELRGSQHPRAIFVAEIYAPAADVRMSCPFASHQFNRGDEELNRELLLAPGNRVPDDASQAAERGVTCSHTSDEMVQVVVTSLLCVTAASRGGERAFGAASAHNKLPTGPSLRVGTGYP
jgi:hypothetical protein